jgi:hypothetical protein
LPFTETANPAVSPITIVVPSKCLRFCKTEGKRFIGMKNGVDCHCFSELPLASMTPVPDEMCQMPGCVGDLGQHCGSDTSMIFFVAECPDNKQSGATAEEQARFGDNCYEELTTAAQTIEKNIDACSQLVMCLLLLYHTCIVNNYKNLQGMSLWYPESREEVTFIHKKFSSESKRHVGFRSISKKKGVETFDYVRFPGVPFVTTRADGSSHSGLSDWTFGSTSCIVSEASKTNFGIAKQSSCPSQKGICKAKLGKRS